MYNVHNMLKSKQNTRTYLVQGTGSHVREQPPTDLSSAAVHSDAAESIPSLFARPMSGQPLLRVRDLRFQSADSWSGWQAYEALVEWLVDTADQTRLQT